MREGLRGPGLVPRLSQHSTGGVGDGYAPWGSGRVRVTTADRRTFAADRAVLAVPARVIDRIRIEPAPPRGHSPRPQGRVVDPREEPIELISLVQ